ncbi:hypothetical protein V8C42DRAFT_325181 [Trichoderma barbatum]
MPGHLVGGHAGQVEMCTLRRKRPLILIGHSMGGLVIKQVLVLAHQMPPTHPDYANHQNFLNSVSSVMFLGTPHEGSSLVKWAKLWMKLGISKFKESHPDLITYLNSTLLKWRSFNTDSAMQSPLHSLRVLKSIATRRQRAQN